eukprot:6182578-Pleurochrysis_carterae.AAC.3
MSRGWVEETARGIAVAGIEIVVEIEIAADRVEAARGVGRVPKAATLSRSPRSICSATLTIVRAVLSSMQRRYIPSCCLQHALLPIILAMTRTYIHTDFGRHSYSLSLLRSTFARVGRARARIACGYFFRTPRWIALRPLLCGKGAQAACQAGSRSRWAILLKVRAQAEAKSEFYAEYLVQENERLACRYTRKGGGWCSLLERCGRSYKVDIAGCADSAMAARRAICRVSLRINFKGLGPLENSTQNQRGKVKKQGGCGWVVWVSRRPWRVWEGVKDTPEFAFYKKAPNET